MRNSSEDTANAPSSGVRSLVIGGLVLVASTFGGFGWWATSAELAAAAIAPGRIGPDGRKRVVQHLEGGIVERLLVREGERVEAGQTLVVLSKAQAGANHLASRGKLDQLLVRRVRLRAERERRPTFALPERTASGVEESEFAAFVANERSIFKTRMRMLGETLTVYARQKGQVREEIASIEAEIEGVARQLTFLEKEVTAKRSLVERGLTRAPELYAVERKSLELSFRAVALRSTIARAKQKIAEIDVEVDKLRTGLVERASDELGEVNREIAQTRQALAASRDVLARTTVVAPVSGQILELAVATVGGVVRGGEPIATIAPFDDELVVEARLAPEDIDNVSQGMVAKVQLNSFMARHLKPLEGTVYHVGADVVHDEATRSDYVPLKVRVSAQDVAKLGKVTLSAGMPADVFVQTGTHTPWRYLADPVRLSFAKAFREEAAAE